MKKFVLSLLFVLVVSGQVFAMNCDDVTMDTIRSRIGMAFPLAPNANILEKEKVENICAVILDAGNYVMPVYLGSKFVLVGTLLVDGNNLTAGKVMEYQKKISKERVKDIKLDDYVAFKYTPKSGDKDKRKVLYFLTDPNCPYCQRAKKELPAIADQYNAEIRVIFYPISVQSEDKSIGGYCGMKYEDYINEKYSVCPQDKAEVYKNKITEFRNKVNVGGVPMFYTQNKDAIEGFDIEGIKRALSN